jgi:hypothetical protein
MQLLRQQCNSADVTNFMAITAGKSCDNNSSRSAGMCPGSAFLATAISAERAFRPNRHEQQTNERHDMLVNWNNRNVPSHYGNYKPTDVDFFFFLCIHGLGFLACFHSDLILKL